MPTTILIDGFNLGLEQGTGVATYARNLSHVVHDLNYRVDVLYGTRASPSINRLIREIAFFDAAVGRPPRWLVFFRRLKDAAISPFGFRAVKVPVTGSVITAPFRARLPYFDQLWNIEDIFNRANRHFKSYKTRLRAKVPRRPDLVHWTYPLPVWNPDTRNIYTLHDLVPLRLPYTTLDNKRLYYRLCRLLVRRADHIVTVSETSRKDIINLLGASPNKVTNTYQAVDIPPKYLEKPEEIVRREVEGTFNLKYKAYFLFFGAVEPKKNVGRLIEAYLASQVDAPLVIVGKSAWKYEEEVRLLDNDLHRYLVQLDQQTWVRHRILRIDYAPFPLLVSLIRGAKATLFPSLYEGFGLPVLESMKLGTPVLSSTAGSIPEVAGDAALLVDPYDTRAMAAAIREIEHNTEMLGDLSARGLRQADLYSVDAYRRRLGNLYEKLLRKPEPATTAALKAHGRSAEADIAGLPVRADVSFP